MPPEESPQQEPLGPDGFQAASGVSRETRAVLETYAACLCDWNQRMNLVGRSTLPDLWQRHMLDSAQLLPLLPPAPEGRARVIVDLGSGAGFPGMVLALMGAGTVHLIDSSQKKAAFLREVAEQTGASVEIHPVRIEEVRPIKADVVTSRALAPLKDLLQHAAVFCHSDTFCLFPKGRKAGQELTEARKAWNITVTEHASRTDPDGKILAVSDLGRAAAKKKRSRR